MNCPARVASWAATRMVRVTGDQRRRISAQTACR
jgi:hypothetical protein